MYRELRRIAGVRRRAGIIDGYFDIRPAKNYEVIIADMNGELLKSICEELRRYYSARCRVVKLSRDKAWRLRIYGKELVLGIHEIAQQRLQQPNETLLEAAIDAEGTVTRGFNQPVRIRITQKRGMKAEAIRAVLEELSVPYLTVRRRGGYVEFVISGRDNVKLLLTKIRVRHPDKVSKLSDL
uniref:rRNA intron-encoded endonuclease n=1 Tax=Thermoproteus sp. IC-070 TaxID=278053 RepID=Q6L6Z2_9CREN|nr:rRNA intron-encoded endonuclease [Thermoproteus sp. IC-070]